MSKGKKRVKNSLKLRQAEYNNSSKRQRSEEFRGNVDVIAVSRFVVQ